MKDIQKIKEFFSKPLNEGSTTFKVGDKVTYLGHPAEITKVNKEMTGAITYNVSYDKGTGKTKATNISNKGGDIKSLNEIDVNDPVLMKARAAAFQRTQPKPEIPKPIKTINPDYKAVKNADKIKALKLKRAELMSDMEQEAEPEGGPIANRYGALLNKIDQAMAKLSGQGDSETNVYMSKDEIDRQAAMMKEGKKETAVDMAKKQLDALGVKYELGNEFKPFEAIYRPNNKSNEFYDEFNRIVWEFNLGSAVKRAMNEVKEEDVVDTITMDVPLFIRMLEYSREDADEDMDLHDVTEKAISLGKERGILQMDDYDEIIGTTEKVNEVNLKQSKLSSAEYQKAKKLKDFKASDWKWNASEDLYTKVIKEGEMNEVKSFTLDSESASDSDKITDFLTSNNIKFTKTGSKIKISLDRDTPKASVILSKLRSLSKFDELNEGELTEANVPSNIREFAKRKGVTPLVNKVAKWAEAVGARIAGGTAIGKNYSTLVLDLDYKQQGEIRIDTDNDTITLFDEPVRSYNEFQRVYSDGQGNNLEEALVKKVISKIREAKSTPCWKGYEQKGMKEKNGKQVPNCVPKK